MVLCVGGPRRIGCECRCLRVPAVMERGVEGGALRGVVLTEVTAAQLLLQNKSQAGDAAQGRALASLVPGSGFSPQHWGVKKKLRLCSRSHEKWLHIPELRTVGSAVATINDHPANVSSLAMELKLGHLNQAGPKHPRYK